MKRRGFFKALFTVAAAVSTGAVFAETAMERHERLIAQALNTPEGRKALVNAMINPIERALEYQKISRKLSMVEPLPGPSGIVYHTRRK